MIRSPRFPSAKVIALATTLLLPLVIQLSPLTSAHQPASMDATASVGVSAGQA